MASKSVSTKKWLVCGKGIEVKGFYLSGMEVDMELNKKLAGWAGFTEVKCKDCYAEPTEYGKGHPHSICHYDYPDDSNTHVELPDFTQSLDACFKWLVPKAYPDSISFDYTAISFECEIKCFTKLYHGKGEREALALCKAIEKLIDSG